MAKGYSVTIRADRRGAPLSKYVYGQFIEHMGRCIYGGIWAEMLEDRKFFHAAGTDESPWRCIGGRAVDWVEGEGYGHRHAPRFAGPDAGIEQDGLGLIEGAEYAGRAVLAGCGPVEVALCWGEGRENRDAVTIQAVPDEFAPVPFRFRAGRSTDAGRLRVVARGDGPVRAAAVSLMPANHVRGMRADTLALLRELDAPLYRWPGGNFVSGYDWRDGLGDPDRRSPRKERAWNDVEPNDFGLDEFMAFCREVGAEPNVVVNTGEGDVAMAAGEVEYANGAADTAMGARRAANGHREPYGVVWWGVGNEMYGDWQLGHMPLEAYVRKHNQFADAMRGVDPAIKLIGVGDSRSGWSEAMLRHCAGHMDLLSEHFYSAHDADLAAHVHNVAEDVRVRAETHRRCCAGLPSLAGRAIRMALDEWNYVRHGEDCYGLHGSRFGLRHALGIAAGLNQMARDSDTIAMAAFAQTVNVIGAIKTSKTAACFSTVGLPLVLYRRHFGTVPVAVEGAAAPLDVAAAWAADGRALTVAVVNACADAADLVVSVAGADLAGTGQCWTITGPDADAFNEPGRDGPVRIEERAASISGGALNVPAVSVCLYRLEVKGRGPGVEG
ncbi:MAG: alpha-N-arabinofuranosidase [Candidatus Hydrogenedentes bacterium]|nr:alpha-N-arabinofuranosidase [Candidatus Hydrogenedentota bacterium]